MLYKNQNCQIMTNIRLTFFFFLENKYFYGSNKLLKLETAKQKGNLHNGTSPVTVQLQYGTPNQENNVHLRFYITPVPFCDGATQRYTESKK